MLITQEEIEGGGEIERFQWTKHRHISENPSRGAYNTLVHAFKAARNSAHPKMFCEWIKLSSKSFKRRPTQLYNYEPLL